MFFPASELSGLVGRNPNVDPEARLLDVLSRYQPAFYQELSSAYNRSIGQDEACERETRNITDSKFYEKVRQDYQILIETPILTETPAVFQKQIYQDRGIYHEKFAIETLKELFPDLSVNTQLYKRYYTVQKKDYIIGGRVDAFRPNGIIEIKLRHKGVLGRKGLSFEIDQLATYAELLNNRDYQYFAIAEYYKNEIYLTEYTKDELTKRWKTLQEEVDKLVLKVHNWKKDPSLSFKAFEKWTLI